MSAVHLILIFLFLAFGTLAVTAETESTRMHWVALAILAVGASVILIAWDGVKAGRIQLQGTTIIRHHRPWLFWAAAGLVATSGVVCVGGGLWALTL